MNFKVFLINYVAYNLKSFSKDKIIDYNRVHVASSLFCSHARRGDCEGNSTNTSFKNYESF